MCKLHQPLICKIQIFGCIEEKGIFGMYDLTISVNKDPDDGELTILDGELPDYAALYGVLNYLYGLGLCLKSAEVQKN